MLDASRERLLARLRDEDLVLDVGAWAKPLPRADWVIDLMPYETRGMLGTEGPPGAPERFSAETWVQRDICAHEPWPFADGEFDFAICSHTLEDVRDPIWVCHELCRVAKAGYVEVPSRLEEQTAGVNGPWAGWSHHHWVVEPWEGGLEFSFKLHAIHSHALPHAAVEGLPPAARVTTLWWEGSFPYRERHRFDIAETEAWLRAPLERHAAERPRGRRRFRR